MSEFIEAVEAPPRETEAGPGVGSARPLAVLGLLILAQLGYFFGIAHRTRPELEVLSQEGTPDERVWALHVLANRGEVDPDDYDASFMRSLLADEEFLVREMALTSDICKMRPPEIQKEYIATYVGDDAHFLRSLILMRRKVGGAMVGGGLKIARKELEWLIMVENGLLPPLEEMQDHFAERSYMIGVRKGIVDPATGEILTRSPREGDENE